MYIVIYVSRNISTKILEYEPLGIFWEKEDAEKYINSESHFLAKKEQIIKIDKENAMIINTAIDKCAEDNEELIRSRAYDNRYYTQQ